MVRHMLAACRVMLVMLTPWFAASAQASSAQASSAQASAARTSADSIPREHLPPEGMCRIWLDGVPPAQQPAPTECSVAVRNQPPNGRVIYGPRKGSGSSRAAPALPIRRFDGSAANQPPVRVPGRPPQSGDSGREPWEARRITDEQLFGDRQATLPVASSAGMMGLTPAAPGFEAYVGQGGLLLGAGPLADPRYFAPGAPPPGRGSPTCLDRDGDGWCDDFRFGPPPCLDRDRDGRCDDLPAFASLPFPQVLPSMQGALDVVQGRPSTEVAQWLGTNEFVVRIPDQGRGGIPWRAIFLDANTNELLQVWTDRSRDGRADRVEVFRNGQRAKLIQR
jgi:hypothetical protein